VLKKVVELPDLSPWNRKYAEIAIEYVETHFDETDRGYRSLVESRLLRERPPQMARVWNTVVQAWNYAVQSTLSPDGASVGYLPDSIAVATYLEEPTDVLLEARDGGLSPGLLGRRPVVTALQWDLSQLNWNRMREIVEETEETRQEFQAALSTNQYEQSKEALKSHIRALKGCVAPQPSDSRRNMRDLIWAIGDVGAVTFGTLGRLTLKEALALPMAHVFDASARETMRQLRRFRIANTLRRSTRNWLPSKSKREAHRA
jgi:hypothetical protein